MNYKKFIQHRSLLLGTLSAKKAAKKLVNELEPESLARYGSDLYEQAYNYYNVVYKKHVVYVLLIIATLIGTVLNFLLFEKYILVSTLITTAVVYFMRKGF